MTISCDHRNKRNSEFFDDLKFQLVYFLNYVKVTDFFIGWAKTTKMVSEVLISTQSMVELL